MFAFLQGFAYGLWLSCMPWLLVGLYDPRLALGTDQPSRPRVLLRYAVLLPFAAFVIWLTSLWGGFGPSLMGWLVGLFAVPAGLFVERRWFSGLRRRRDLLKARKVAEAARERRQRFDAQQRELGLIELRPDRLPLDADDLVRALCAEKVKLTENGGSRWGLLADRVAGRYLRLRRLLAERFDPRELTFERANSLVVDVSRAALEDLGRLTVLVVTNAGIDEAFVRRRLDAADALPDAEREALMRRLELLRESENRIQEQNGRIEAALTALDDAALAVAALDTSRPRTRLKADEALSELSRFASTLKRFEQPGS